MENSTSKKIPIVLLVDDSSLDLYINNYIIKEYTKDCEVIQFTMATDVLEYLIKHQDIADKIPDIILLDINMPQMNGFEFLEEYEKLNDLIKNKCRIYVLSSSFDPEDIRKSKDNPNVTAFLEKPLTIETLDEIFAGV